MPPVIIDGHNDLALRVWLGQEPAHIDLAAARENGFAGGLFALSAVGGPFALPDDAPYSLPLEEPVPHEKAVGDVAGQLAALEGLDVEIVRRVEDIRPGRVNAIVHFEGAEPIAADLSDIEDWYDRGLRSVGIVWSRPNAFGEGVPFRFPSTGDTGGGLTAPGRDLVHACNLLGIVIDVSHLNEAGFWDVARLTQAPVVATHSNVHSLCASSRNLTDRQLDAIGESGGVVGINFATLFLREDGLAATDVPIDADRPPHRLRGLEDRGRTRRVRVGLRRSGRAGRARRGGRPAAARRCAALRRSRRRLARPRHARQLAPRPR